jgi:hypothetical protein
MHLGCSMVVGLILKFNSVKHFLLFSITLLVFNEELKNQYRSLFVFLKTEMCPKQVRRQVYSFMCVCVCLRMFLCFNRVRFYLQQGLLVLQPASVSVKMFLVEKLSPVKIHVPFLIIFSLLLLFTCYYTVYPVLGWCLLQISGRTRAFFFFNFLQSH